MKTLRQIASSLCLGILTAALIAGCATRRDVQEIVTGSNAAILTSQLGGDTDNVFTVDGKGRPGTLDGASARIDAFISAHPDQPATAAALRIRQGMLLLAAKEPTLAKAAFLQATNSDLHGPRDQTLKEISPILIWWVGGASSDATGFNDGDYPQASNALPRLLVCQSNLTVLAATDPEVEGIRDYVAEMRAWIGLRYVSALGDTQLNVAQSKFLDTITNYVASLGTNTSNRILCGCKCKDEQTPSTITLDLRRCFRARTVLKYAFEVRRDALGQNPPTLPKASEIMVQPWN